MPGWAGARQARPGSVHPAKPGPSQGVGPLGSLQGSTALTSSVGGGGDVLIGDGEGQRTGVRQPPSGGEQPPTA